ncbi:MAG: N-acetyltransferase family protein [Nitrospirota bacterium]
MEFSIRRVRESDGSKIIGIFNYHAGNSLAAYPVETATLHLFDQLRETTCGTSFYVIEKDQSEVVGFGLLKEHHPSAAFCRTADLAYLISPGFRNQGLGSMLFDVLINDAKKMKIVTLLAGISSLDEESITFHRKKGFGECGRFKKVGIKHGKEFDVVWMQKFI